jgi:geranylgeranyl diphosphate synthase type I
MINEQIQEVRQRMLACMAAPSLEPLAQQVRPTLAVGKMLRARLLLRVGAATGCSREHLLCAAASVELVHAASLLHDDVIDGGRVRRGHPALWCQAGVRSAILVGDLMVCHAFALIYRSGRDATARALAEAALEMCRAESQQELLLKGGEADWETCLSVSRRKTGSLFAFAAGAAAGPGTDTDSPLAAALREAGYAVGTAYQLADDVFDAHGDPLWADKTLGADAANAKPTAAAAAAAAGIDPARLVRTYCDSARAGLAPWPAVLRAWDHFMARDMQPALDGFLAEAAAGDDEAPCAQRRGDPAG